MTEPAARAQAIAWQDGRIVAVGDKRAVARVARGLGIEPEDASGLSIVPGFVDAHMHFLHVGIRRRRPDLRGATSREEAEARTRAWLAAHPGPAPVIAEGWDESTWPERRFPTRDDLDAVSPRRPLVWRRMDGHVAVANSPALAAIRAHWDDDAFVDTTSGLLLEDASLYLNEVIAVPPEDLDAALDAATAVAHAEGVTAIGEYAQAPFRAAYLRAAADGRLRLRVACSIYVQDLDRAVADGFRTGRVRSPWLRDGGVKIFLDGSFGARTAFLRSPYADGPAGAPTRGRPNWTRPDLQRWFRRAHGAHVQIHAHAIGDAAIDLGLDAFANLADPRRNPATGVRADEEAGTRPPDLAGTDARGSVAGRSDAESDGPRSDARGPSLDADGPRSGGDARTSRGDTPRRVAADRASDSGGVNPLRHRFEHYELPQDDALDRTIALGILACAQPNFVGVWSHTGGMYERRIGPTFALNNRYRTWLDRGLGLSFGSDGMPFGPRTGIAAALRHPLRHEILRPDEAVWLYTARAAHAIHWDDAVGRLEPHMEADLLILDTPTLDDGKTPRGERHVPAHRPSAHSGDARPRDAIAILTEEARRRWPIRETIVDGRTVFAADAARA
jgi:predicted amidohydrolase YtcJ